MSALGGLLTAGPSATGSSSLLADDGAPTTARSLAAMAASSAWCSPSTPVTVRSWVGTPPPPASPARWFAT
jgi:hypothetical protein